MSEEKPLSSGASGTAPGYSMGQLILYALRLGTFGFGGPSP
jgi:chromate transporter